MTLNDAQLKALVEIAKKNPVGHIKVEPITRPGYPNQWLDAIAFAVYGNDDVEEGIMDEHGVVVA